MFWGNLPKDSWPFNNRYDGVPGLYWHSSAPLPDLIGIGNTIVGGGSTNEAVSALLAADASGNSARLTAAADERGGRGVRFTRPEKDDWTPQPKSPMVNAGVPCDWMEGARDLAGRPRVFNGLPDIGCYEKVGDPPTLLILR